MDDWKTINQKYRAILKEKKFIPGAYYRAVTIDGDIFDGILTFVNIWTVELQIGESFKSFSRGCTKLVKLTNLERE
jgi:hypothetical protein